MLFRLCIVVGGLVSAFGVFWIYWVLVKEGRSFNFEVFCALTLLGGGFLSSFWAQRKMRQRRFLQIDRHVIELARSQNEIGIADIMASDGMDIGSHEAQLSLERLASGKVGTIGVSEVGSPVFRLDDAEKSIWLDV